MLPRQSIAGVFVCFTFVASQFVPPQNGPVCTDAAVQAGNGLLPHETYCEQFYHCGPQTNRDRKTCPYGTVYDDSVYTCVRPEVATCNNWLCDANRVSRNYPAVCCDQYYTCTGSGFTKNNCTSGLVFDMIGGQCVSGTCVDQPGCVRFGTNTASTAKYQCYDVPNRFGNPCLYDTVYNGINIPNRPCAYGTAFSEQTCQCSIVSPLCPDGVNITDNKIPDNLCRSTLTLEFNSFPLVASNEKLGLAKASYYFQSSGVTVSGGNGYFSVDPSNGLQPYVYSYFLNGNQLATPFAMSIVFKWSNPTNGQVLTLLANNYYTKACTTTYEVSVTYNSGAYKVSLFAIGVNSITKALTQGSTSATLQLTAGNYLEVLVLFNGYLSGQLIDRGLNGLAQTTPTTNKVDIPATAWLGDYIQTNKCGLMVAKGLTGAVERFQVREGCTDFSKVRA